MNMKVSRFLSAFLAIIFSCECYLGMASTNLALNKPSIQSQTLTSFGVTYYASRANDGDGATRSLTHNTQPSYLHVDLQEQVDVTFILLKMQGPWNNLYVGVGNSPPTTSSVPYTDFGVCKHFTGLPDHWIQTIPCALTGRYVILFSDFLANLRVMEVEVYNTPEPGKHGIGQYNLARGKPSFLSATKDGYPASQGNDAGADWSLMARADPGASLPAYWFVDMTGRFQVTSIVFLFCQFYIASNTRNHSNRLTLYISQCFISAGEWANLLVGVSDNPLTSASMPGQNFAVCYSFTGNPFDWMQNITCSITGRYVIIYNGMSTNFQLNEVEVYGIPNPGIDCGTPTAPGNAMTTLTSGLSFYNDSASIDCDTGYNFNDGTTKKSLTCTIAGTWNTDPSDLTACVLADCGALPIVPLNTLLKLDVNGSSTYESTATVVCAEGFKLKPGIPTSLTCGADALWVPDITGLSICIPHKRKRNFNAYQNRRDVMRNVNIIQNLKARSKTQCANECLNTEACVGFTYYGTTCRLHHERAQDYTGGGEQFVAKSGAVYMQVKDEL